MPAPRKTSPSIRTLAALLLAISGWAPGTALAQYFTPTQSEWLAWPRFCQAKHVSRVGNDSSLGAPISQGEIAGFEQRMQDVWAPLHHYCWGLSKVPRALSEPTQQRRVYFMRDAVSEFKYFFERVPNTHPMFVDALAQSCNALGKVDDYENAVKFCDLAIEAQPDNGAGYMAKAMLLRRQKRTDEALEVLEKGNTAAKGESAEIHYLLGLTYLDLKSYEPARAHARDAYRLGYPLPALRDRLRQAGYPLD